MLGGNETGVWWAAHSPESLLDVFFFTNFSRLIKNNAWCMFTRPAACLFVCVCEIQSPHHRDVRWTFSRLQQICQINGHCRKKKTCHLCYLSELAVVVSLWSANMTVFICPYKINSAMFISSPHPSEFIWTAASGPYHLYEWTNSHCK